MTAPDLAAFVLARIAEREAQAPHVHLDDCASGYVDYITGDPGGECDCGEPARVLAWCAAVRAIVELHRHDHACPDSSGMDGYTWVTAPRNANCATMLALAQPYADHPDFNPAWQV